MFVGLDRMLTKGDLTEIKQLFGENNDVLLQKIDMGIDKKLEKRFKPILKELRKLRKDLHVTITSFDREIIDTRHRVDPIEDHLNLPPLQAN